MWKIILCFFILLFSYNLQGQKEIDLDRKVKVSELNQVDFNSIIRFLEESYTLEFSYSSTVIDDTFVYKFNKQEYTIAELLQELSVQQGASYIKLDNKILFIEYEKPPQSIQLYGFIKDAQTGEVLIGASIYSQKSLKGTITNEFGYYTSEFSSNAGNIIVSYIGYEEKILKPSQSKKRMDIFLSPSILLDEIVVLPEFSINDHWIGTKVIEGDFNKSLAGENDIIQTLRKQPGVQSGSEVQGNLIIRGGGPDQNLVLLDGIPLYEVNHLLGVVSIFNQEAINDVEFYNEAFTPKYGGRLSSFTNIRLKEGSLNKPKFSASLGLLGANIHLEGPISKGKSSYNFSARTSYINRIIQPLARRYLDLEKTDFSFSDLNFKFTQKLTENSTISLSTFLGSDHVGFSDILYDEEQEIGHSDNTVKWKNQVFNIRYRILFGSKLFSNFSISSVSYILESRSINSYLNFQTNEFENIEVATFSKINDINFRNDWEYHLNNQHKLIAGVGLINHKYLPTVRQQEYIPSFVPDELEIPAKENFFYFSDQINLAKNLILDAGFHLSNFRVENSNYSSFQPRLHLHWDATKKISFDLSYNLMTQYVHLLFNPGIGLPSDLWVPSTDLIKPQEAVQYDARMNILWSEKFNTIITGYFKDQKNLIEYESPYDLYNPVINNSTVPVFQNGRDWEDRVDVGTGRAYGVDFLQTYQSTNYLFSASYSYGRSNRIFPSINNGKAFPYKYERNHDIYLSSSLRLNAHFSFGAQWIYGTGHKTSLPLTQFQDSEGQIILDFSKRNNFTLPAYHKLDINMNYIKVFPKYEIDISVGINNVYNRRNTFYVYLYEDEEKGVFIPKQVSVFPILPFCTFKIKG